MRGNEKRRLTGPFHRRWCCAVVSEHPSSGEIRSQLQPWRSRHLGLAMKRSPLQTRACSPSSLKLRQVLTCLRMAIGFHWCFHCSGLGSGWCQCRSSRCSLRHWPNWSSSMSRPRCLRLPARRCHPGWNCPTQHLRSRSSPGPLKSPASCLWRFRFPLPQRRGCLGHKLRPSKRRL